MSRPHATLSLHSAIVLLRVASLSGCVMLLTVQAALSASPIQQLTNHTSVEIRPAWSPDGQRIAFQSGRGNVYQVYTMNADGSGEQRISADGVDDRHPSWSPDGQRLAVASGGDAQREVWTIDLLTGERTRVSQPGLVASFPTWSPDGSQMSFYGFANGQLDLWVIGANGANLRQMTNGLASEQRRQCTFACHGASWSPDGSRIAYAAPDPPQVWTMRAADGTDAVNVSVGNDPARSHFPIYLPDGRLLYVTEHVTPGKAWTDVWALSPGNAGSPTVVLSEVQAQGPFAFSGDGQWLAFSSPRSGNFDIYRVRLDEAGKASLQVKSGETEPSPGLAPRISHPSELPNVAPPGTAGTATTREQRWLQELQPYLLAGLGTLIAVWLAVEGLRLSRRRARRR